MNKGDIVFGKRGSDAIHPIVYLRDYDDDSFIGVMLTKSSNYKSNVLMAEKHFKKADLEGKKYEFCFNDTHMVNEELIKRGEWKPFKKVGELTDEGIEFIESQMSDENPMFWEDPSSTKNR